MKKEKRGGKRPGAGQPKKAPTGTISYRVPLPVAMAWKALSIEEKKRLRDVLITEVEIKKPAQ